MTWNNVLLSGLAASLALVGCTVTTSPDGTPDGGATGGAASSAGGSGTAGAGGTAGASHSGGAAGRSTGGATGSGGAAPDSGCNVCLKSKCAAEFNDCTNDPDHACGDVSATDPGEFVKIQLCMFAVTGDSSVPVFTSQDLETCAGVPSKATLALITCARGAEDASTQPCTKECYGAPVPY